MTNPIQKIIKLSIEKGFVPERVKEDEIYEVSENGSGFNEAIDSYNLEKIIELAYEKGRERGNQEMFIIADVCEKKGWSFDKFLLLQGKLLTNLTPNKEE